MTRTKQQTDALHDLFLAYESALQRLGIFTGFVLARSLAEINPEETARMNYARQQLNELRFERVNWERVEAGLARLEKPKPFPTAEEEAAIAAAAIKPSQATASNGAYENVEIAAEDDARDGA